MKPDFYIFEYSTKTCKHKRISYTACSWKSALRRFKKNVRCTKLLDTWKVSSGYPHRILSQVRETLIYIKKSV